MAYNELFALAFVAPYIASEKKISSKVIQEMMRRGLYHVKSILLDSLIKMLVIVVLQDVQSVIIEKN